MMKRKSYVIPSQQMGLFEAQTPSMPVLDASRCQARIINHETAARMVETYHYAHRVPSIVVAVGMFVDEILAGVCTYGIPANQYLCKAFGEEYTDKVIELNRLFIFDWAGRNSESWLVAQSFKLIPKPYCVLISYADTKMNHLGGIYQATNWIYTGLGSGSKEVTINGKLYHSKNVHNVFGTNQLEKIRELGLDVTEDESTGKHRYVYFLGDRRQRRALRAALKWPVLPYPKAKVPQT